MIHDDRYPVTKRPGLRQGERKPRAPVAVLSHGLVKERAVPPREIALAIRRKGKYETDPKSHTYSEG